MKQNKLTRLFDRYVDGTADEHETALVEAYLDEMEKGPVKQRTAKEEQAIEARMLTKIRSRMKAQTAVVTMNRWWKLGAAAAVVIIALSFWLTGPRRSGGHINEKPQTAASDIQAPGLNRATITLADGSRVFLDDAGNEQLAIQGNTKLVKLADGSIAYSSTEGEVITTVYNTLSNPRGSKVIDITLSDGSHVWLNSGSSITFPVAFAGGERKVTVDGEAYFEVAHNPLKPFIVNKGVTSVRVLGTHFNVNAYDDEDAVRVTLLEGSVEVNTHSVNLRAQKVRIRPGEQAVAGLQSQLTTRLVDTDEVMAWKEGMFLLNNTDLPTLMRQISRWYNVDVRYEGKIPGTKFGGGVSMDQPLSKILETLERYGLDFDMEGKTIKVK